MEIYPSLAEQLQDLDIGVLSKIMNSKIHAIYTARDDATYAVYQLSYNVAI